MRDVHTSQGSTWQHSCCYINFGCCIPMELSVMRRLNCPSTFPTQTVVNHLTGHYAVVWLSLDLMLTVMYKIFSSYHEIQSLVTG